MRTLTLGPQSFVPQVRGFGTVEPARTWNAVAQVSGRIDFVHPNFRRGELMKAGTEVLRINPRDYELAKREAEKDRQENIKFIETPKSRHRSCMMISMSLRDMPAKPWPVEPIQPGELENADLELGESRARKCTPCHTFIPNKGGRRGPSLWNVVGRPKATISSFKFSPAMKAQTGIWTFEELNRYISDVYGRVPGTVNKYFGVERDRKMRIALIAYLRTQAYNPVPLPGE